MIPNQQLTAQEIRATVIEIGKEYLPLQAEGYKCTTEMLYDVLLKAAAEGISIEAACSDLADVVDSNTIRALLNAQLSKEELRAHERRFNEALAFGLPRQIRTGRLQASMDEHDEPFYGKTPAVRQVACRGKAEQGTTYFTRIASAYVVYHQMRLTLAITFVLPQDSTLAVVQRLYDRLRELKLHIGVLYLDKGFCSSEVIDYLETQKQAAVLACPIRGKQGGTRRLCKGRKSYRTRYTFTQGAQAEVAVVATLVPGKEGKRRRKWHLFVVIGLGWAPKTVFRRYRFRFGIESSYRALRQVRIKTTSRNPVMRFFLLAFALLLVNLWAFLRWFVARVPGPGPHRVKAAFFRFQRFIQFLRRAVETVRGVVNSLTFPLLTKPVIY